MRQQRQGDFTVMGLQLNIEQMMDYMELKGLSGHLGLFRYTLLLEGWTAALSTRPWVLFM